MADAHKICQEMGIRVHGRATTHPKSNVLPARHTWARKTVRLIAERGERLGRPDHVYDVLTLLTTSGNGEIMLFSDVMDGVSKWALKNNLSSHEVPFLSGPWSNVDLHAIRSAVVYHRIEQRAAQVAFLIAAEMEDAIKELRS